MSEGVKLTRPSPDLRKQIERAENVQVVVAVAVLSGYLTILTEDDSLFDSFSAAIDILAFVALVFLAGKLFTLTLRPFFQHNYLAFIDQKILPGMFAFIFLITFAVILPTVLPFPDVDFDVLIDRLSQIIPSPLEAADIYIFIWAVVSLIIGWRYASLTSETMSELETAAPDVRLTFSSGERGQTFPLTLKNPYDEEIPPEDIRIEVEPSSGVEVDVPQAENISTNVWRPRLQIPADSRMNVNFKITRSDDAEEISEESIEITTKYLGRVQQRNIVELEG